MVNQKYLRNFRERTIRFKRVGSKDYPVYNIIMTYKDMRGLSGFYIEKLGFFNPHSKDRQLFINTERLAYLARLGVHINPTVKKYLVKFLVA